MRRTQRTPPHQNTLTNSRNFTVPLRPVTEGARVSSERCSLCRPSFFCGLWVGAPFVPNGGTTSVLSQASGAKRHLQGILFQNNGNSAAKVGADGASPSRRSKGAASPLARWAPKKGSHTLRYLNLNAAPANIPVRKFRFLQKPQNLGCHDLRYGRPLDS